MTATPAAGGAVARSYHHHDGLYSTRATTGDAGAVAARFAYDPYGKPTLLDAAGAALADQTPTEANAILFTGRRADPETGLQYSRARYYDNTLGRWIGRDPIGYVDVENRYQYVRSMPTFAADPSGLQTACTGYRESDIIGKDATVPFLGEFNFSFTFLKEVKICNEKCKDCRIATSVRTKTSGRGNVMAEESKTFVTPFGPVQANVFAQGTVALNLETQTGGCDQTAIDPQGCTEFRFGSGVEGCYGFGVKACIRGEGYFSYTKCYGKPGKRCAGGRLIARGCIGIGSWQRCKELLIAQYEECTTLSE